MSQVFRFFLTVEGRETGFPNYDNAIVHFLEHDPSTVKFANSFISSPLFSVKESGVHKCPNLDNNTVITFLMVPKIFPDLEEIVQDFSLTDELWFSLGLANLVVIENKKNQGVTQRIVERLTKKANLNASESWIISNNKIAKHELPFTKSNHIKVSHETINIDISEKLPLHLKFTVSEFILSANKFLQASKKFTPAYYKKHYNTVDASIGLINDLSFLHGDTSHRPVNLTLQTIVQRHKSNLENVYTDIEFLKVKDDLINDFNGRLIQFNSALSYIYSQTYAGTFPLFDHFGMIQRYSLLGVGSAISALTELLIQLESALYFLPFERMDESSYADNVISNINFFSSFASLGSHELEPWEQDVIRNKLIRQTNPSRNRKELPQDFFIRLAFFSGRLGFREYDFSATAALQVLVESNSLQWNVINYTHEIIHNHVRIILNNLLLPLHESRSSTYDSWLDIHISKLGAVFHSLKKRELHPGVTYREFFIFILFKYCINYKYYGSLSYPSNQKEIKILKGDTTKTKKYYLPKPDELKPIILQVYKDITEIFVHVIDYAYIYSRNVDTYLQSIWASWSTVTTVASDLKQYILRTLIISSLNKRGTLGERYKEGKKSFLIVLEKIVSKGKNSYLFSRIKEILENENDDDLKARFFNCMIVGDLVYNFFVGELEVYLDNSDSNRLSSSTTGNHLYDIETNSFRGSEIRSKVRFSLDQLMRECDVESDQIINDDKQERTSAWLLLSISSSY